MLKVTIYRRWTILGKLWFWRARNTGNGRIMAVGGEGFWNLADCKESAGKVQMFLPLAEVVVDGERVDAPATR